MTTRTHYYYRLERMLIFYSFRLISSHMQSCVETPCFILPDANGVYLASLSKILPSTITKY